MVPTIKETSTKLGDNRPLRKDFLEMRQSLQPITTKHSGSKGNVYPMDVTIVRGLAKWGKTSRSKLEETKKGFKSDRSSVCLRSLSVRLLKTLKGSWWDTKTPHAERPTEKLSCYIDKFFSRSNNNRGEKEVSLKAKRYNSPVVLLLNKKFEEKIRQFKTYLAKRNYPKSIIDNRLSKVKIERRKRALLPQGKTNNQILPFVVTQYYRTVPNLK